MAAAWSLRTNNDLKPTRGDAAENFCRIVCILSLNSIQSKYLSQTCHHSPVSSDGRNPFIRSTKTRYKSKWSHICQIQMRRSFRLAAITHSFQTYNFQCSCCNSGESFNIEVCVYEMTKQVYLIFCGCFGERTLICSGKFELIPKFLFQKIVILLNWS